MRAPHETNQPLFAVYGNGENNLTSVRKYAKISSEGEMPQIEVIFFKDDDGAAPVLDWLDGLGEKAQAKCLVKIERLQQMGHELRRPEADYLRDGIYELRIGHQGINYRILYFFHRRMAAVLAQGLVKERTVPSKYIALAIKRKIQFECDPDGHTYQED